MNRRLRVGLDLTPLLGPPAGVHQVTRGLLDALVQRTDVDVRGWLLSARGARPDVDIPVRRSRIPARLAQRGWAMAAFPPARLIAGRVDVVHGTNFLAPPSRRSVVSVQDLSPILHPQWCRPEVVAMAAPLRGAVRRGATIHVSSHAMADEARSVLDVPEGRLHVVHHAVGPVGPGDPGLGRSLAGADRYALVLGTVEARKNIGAAIMALSEFPTGTRLVIAGAPGNDEAAVSAVSDSRLVRLPVVDEHQRNSLLRGAHVLAFPSRYEGFSLPPLEALSVGTPTVATAVGALPELIGDEITLVPPGDDEAFATALVAAMNEAGTVPDPIAARISEMTWERAAEHMMTVYRAVAGQTGGDPSER